MCILMKTSFWISIFLNHRKFIRANLSSFHSFLPLHTRHHGSRPKEAYEAIKCAKALDAVQDGRHLGAQAHCWTSQGSRVPPPFSCSPKSPQVCLDKARDNDDPDAEARQGGRQGAHRDQLPDWIHGRD